MEVRDRIETALKDLPVAEQEMLDAFFAFANDHLAQAIRTVNEMNADLERIHEDLSR